MNLFKTLYSLCCLFLLFHSTAVTADALTITIKDQNKKAIVHGVAYAIPLDVQQGTPSQANDSKKPKIITINQRNNMFQPYVSVLQIGTKIQLLNQDPIKHHVYSFSKAKNFEIPLYSGKPPKIITLDHAGMVVLGCNIHDWMLAYIIVIDTPFFDVSDVDGQLSLKNLPKGRYRLVVWHPQQKGVNNIEKIIEIPSAINNFKFQIPLQANWRALNKPRSDSTAKYNNNNNNNNNNNDGDGLF
jgi:plastocyanin